MLARFILHGDSPPTYEIRMGIHARSDMIAAMKRATRGHTLLPLVLTAGVAACSLDGASPITDPGATTGEAGTPITTFTTPPSGGCPAVRANTVLVDATHDGGVWWFPQSATQPSGFRPDSAHQGKALADYLRSRGFTVTELGRGDTIPGDSLLSYATVIRAGYYYDAVRPGYSSADLAAYAAYTACSRTLVLLGEFLRDGRRDVLADSLGIPFSGLEYGTISTLVAHELTDSVTSVPWIEGLLHWRHERHGVRSAAVRGEPRGVGLPLAVSRFSGNDRGAI